MKEMLEDFDKKNNARNDDDDSDEFGVFDPAKHVSFDEKIRFSEQIKKCSRDKLTEIVKAL